MIKIKIVMRRGLYLYLVGYLLGKGSSLKADSIFLEVMVIYEKTGHKIQQIWPLPYLSFVEWQLDNKELSRKHLYQALKISNSSKNLFGTALSILIYALILTSEAKIEPHEIRNRKMERAIELIEYAQEVYFINNEFFKFLPQKEIKLIESNLPSNIFEAAKRRGLTLEVTVVVRA